jgi:hypothetical protein
MSWSTRCVLPWNECDLERVRPAIEQAIRDCAAKWPAYADARVEVDVERSALHVHFSAELVEKPHWETVEPQSSAADGTYPCTFRHYCIEPEPAQSLGGECGVSLDSNTSANRDAWVTASYVLERMTQLLGGTLRS